MRQKGFAHPRGMQRRAHAADRDECRNPGLRGKDRHLAYVLPHSAADRLSGGPVASFDDDPDLPADDDIHLVAWLALAAEHLLIRVDVLAGDGRHLLDLEWGEISEQ